MAISTIDSKRAHEDVVSDRSNEGHASPAVVLWLVPLTSFVNLVVLGLLITYGALNLLPDIPVEHQVHPPTYIAWAVLLGVLLPTLASLVFVLRLLTWARHAMRRSAYGQRYIPDAIARRAAAVPLVLAAFSFAGWLLVAAYVASRATFGHSEIPAGHGLHFISRPALVGLIAAAATFFAAEHLCRTRIWSVLLSSTRIAGNPLLWRVRVRSRLAALWLVAGAMPLGAVAFTTFAHVASSDLSMDPAAGRLANVLLLIAVSATVGGGWFAWMVSISVTQPLRILELATARLSEGHFDTRVPVSATDEFGALAEGFNFAARRLAQTYAELEGRNRELADALNRVVFLEHVKRGLDRFVPETVRREIEKNPEAPALAKHTKNVSVLFLDIEGYTRLTATLARPELNALVERYFSLFLTTIRAEGGDINETAGDGLMILFQARRPSEDAMAAVRAALKIKRQTAAANREPGWRNPISVNIGISSGECDVGATRFGGLAGERWTYTASGQVTNIAARLGDYAKGGQILISSTTAIHIREHFELHSLGKISLKNLSHSEETWEVREEIPPAQ